MRLRDVIGRDAELEAVDALLDRGRERLSALLLEGEAGIGKTTVLREARVRAQARGFRVLACGPSSSETTLSLAAVADLLDAVPGPLWRTVPVPQRRALDVAALRMEPGTDPVDPRAVAAGFRSLVAALAAEQPVLIAIDDVQWLDAASATTLAFAFRRLATKRVSLLCTLRSSEPARLDLAALVRPDALERRRLGPLSPGALQRALTERLGGALPRPALARVHETSLGNPLFALEIGRLLMERGAASWGEPLPVPDDIRELVRVRVAALPAATMSVLLAAALLAQPKVETLARVFPELAHDLEPAERDTIAWGDGEMIAFAHPLYAAAVVSIAGAAERRDTHRRLAAAVERLEERARHAGLAANGPDAATARLLDDGAAEAAARGARDSAAELLERARRLTPSSDLDAARARGVRAAELYISGGDGARARALLQALLAEPLAPAQRGVALRLLAELSFYEEELLESERLLSEALAVDGDATRSARVLVDLMYVTTGSRMDYLAAAEFGHQALENLRDVDEPALTAEALAYSAMADFLSGRGFDQATTERALALEDPDRFAPVGLPPGAVVGLLQLYAGRHDGARELLERARLRLGERGDERVLAHVLVWLSWLETRCGDFAAAARWAEEAIGCAELTGDRSMRRLAIAQRAFVHAHRGEIDEARQCVAAAQPPHERGIAPTVLWLAASLALVELSVGDAAAAWRACGPLTESVEQFGIGEPVPLFFLPDALEALLALGELDRAEALLDQLEARGRELGRAWALATGGRCRGLLLAARGDLAGSLDALDRALIEHDRIDLPFDRARTLLVKGVTERKLRRIAAARRTLEEAAGEFARMGAQRWAERASSELQALGGRRPTAHGELTPSERRVADLAATGLSNKEIATQLVIGVHTVEVHLSRAYAKLGVRSRSQLVRRLAPGQ